MSSTKRPKRTPGTPPPAGRRSGPRYKVTTRIGDRTLTFEEPACDPFVRTTVTIGWPDLLRGLLRRRLVVTVVVKADPATVDNVLALDFNARTSSGVRPT